MKARSIILIIVIFLIVGLVAGLTLETTGYFGLYNGSFLKKLSDIKPFKDVQPVLDDLNPTTMNDKDSDNNNLVPLEPANTDLITTNEGNINNNIEIANNNLPDSLPNGFSYTLKNPLNSIDENDYTGVVTHNELTILKSTQMDMNIYGEMYSDVLINEEVHLILDTKYDPAIDEIITDVPIEGIAYYSKISQGFPIYATHVTDENIIDNKQIYLFGELYSIEEIRMEYPNLKLTLRNPLTNSIMHLDEATFSEIYPDWKLEYIMGEMSFGSPTIIGFKIYNNTEINSIYNTKNCLHDYCINGKNTVRFLESREEGQSDLGKNYFRVRIDGFEKQSDIKVEIGEHKLKYTFSDGVQETVDLYKHLPFTGVWSCPNGSFKGETSTCEFIKKYGTFEMLGEIYQYVFDPTVTTFEINEETDKINNARLRIKDFNDNLVVLKFFEEEITLEKEIETNVNFSFLETTCIYNLISNSPVVTCNVDGVLEIIGAYDTKLIYYKKTNLQDFIGHDYRVLEFEGINIDYVNYSLFVDEHEGGYLLYNFIMEKEPYELYFKMNNPQFLVYNNEYMRYNPLLWTYLPGIEFFNNQINELYNITPKLKLIAANYKVPSLYLEHLNIYIDLNAGNINELEFDLSQCERICEDVANETVCNYMPCISFLEYTNDKKIISESGIFLELENEKLILEIPKEPLPFEVTVNMGREIDFIEDEEYPDGLIHYWKFDELINGVGVIDEVGRMHGTATNVEAVNNHVFRFYEDSNVVLGFESKESQPDVSTISLWFKSNMLDIETEETLVTPIFSKLENFRTQQNEYEVRLDVQTPLINNEIEKQEYLSYTYGRANADPNDGTIAGIHSIKKFDSARWHHVVLEQSNKRYKFYLDGILEKDATYRWANSTPLPNYKFDGYFIIGGNKSNATRFNTDFQGYIDEVKMYNRALSHDQVRELYEAGRVS
jgi:hypothetical protein